jgi:hypothetical protein
VPCSCQFSDVPWLHLSFFYRQCLSRLRLRLPPNLQSPIPWHTSSTSLTPSEEESRFGNSQNPSPPPTSPSTPEAEDEPSAPPDGENNKSGAPDNAKSAHEKFAHPLHPYLCPCTATYPYPTIVLTEPASCHAHLRATALARASHRDRSLLLNNDHHTRESTTKHQQGRHPPRLPV